MDGSRKAAPIPEFGSGDPVGWFMGAGYTSGAGIIVDVVTQEGGTKYEVQRLIDGKAVGRTLVVRENDVYPIRGVRDPRPQPAIHREPPL